MWRHFFRRWRAGKRTHALVPVVDHSIVADPVAAAVRHVVREDGDEFDGFEDLEVPLDRTVHLARSVEDPALLREVSHAVRSNGVGVPLRI